MVALLSGVSNEVEIYDFATNSFDMGTPKLKTGRWSATTSLLPNGKVLVAGGQSPTDDTDTVELYTP